MRQSTFSTTKLVLLLSALLIIFLASCDAALAQDKTGSNEKIKELKKKRLALLEKVARGSRFDPQNPLATISIWTDVFAARLDRAERKEERISICEEQIRHLETAEKRLAELFQLADPAINVTRLHLDRMQAYILEAQIQLEIAKAEK